MCPPRPDDGLSPALREAITHLAASTTPADLPVVVEQMLTTAGQDPRAMALAAARGQGPALQPRREQVVTYRVRVDLTDVRPPVWRRLELASNLPLGSLHSVLQAAMGWTDSHLHRFAIGGPPFSRGTTQLLTPLDLEEGDVDGIPESDVRLDQVLAEVGDRLYYAYDFGDGWEHVLRLEAVLSRTASAPPAVVVGGRRACPPEDVGGPYGYADLLDDVAEARRPDAPPDPERDERLQWAGPLDPELFDVEQAQVAVGLALEAPDMYGAPAPVLALVARATGPGSAVVARLVNGAGLHRPDGDDAALDRAAVAAAVRPWSELLRLIGPDGAPLTASGYLKPDLVTALREVVDPHHDWIGTGNREVHTIPVLDFRTEAQALGLVRKYRGRLVPTPAGRRAAGDPERLLDHLLKHLPLGSAQYEQDAGVLVLLAVAGGQSPFAEAEPLLGAAMDALGWSVDGQPVRGFDLSRAADRTASTLRLLGALVHPRHRVGLVGAEDLVGPHGVAVARRALRRWAS